MGLYIYSTSKQREEKHGVSYGGNKKSTPKYISLYSFMMMIKAETLGA